MLELHFSDTLLSSIGGSNITFSREITSYNSTKSASIGYDAASMSLLIRYTDMLDLAQWLIGKELFVYIETSLIWSGIVNEISMSVGQENITLGPYLDICNKVLVRYTDYTTGVPGVTTYANDTTSQSRYGTLIKILNGSSISSTNAEKIRDKYLLENSYPKVNKSVGASAGTRSFNISCVGHYHLLNTYVYNTTSGGTVTLSTKITNVLSANPNNVFLNDYTSIESNSLTVSSIENTDRLGVDIIKELVSLGDDTTNNKTFFYINGRRAYYKTLDYTTQYYLDVSSRSNLLTNFNNYEISPWDIEPGYFVELVGNIGYQSNVYHNTRLSLIDSVTYTYPYSFQISSGDSGTLSQQLAKLGISGL